MVFACALQRHVDTHFSGFRTHHMHNLTELVQGTLAFHVSLNLLAVM